MEGNRAVRIHGKNDLRVETLDIPEPPENFVQLRMSTVGLCRTDVHLFEEGRVDHIIINKPITIGHEISGTVSKLGPGVTDLAVGDRVAIDPCRPCGICHQCRRKRSNICQNMDISGVLHVDGGFANYMITPAYTCYKLPDNVSLEEGAMMEPLSVGVNAVHRAQMNPGDSVIVFGAGPVGLFAMQSAKALGAGKVMMVDINENRLNLAKKLGADIIYRPPGPMVDPQLAGAQLKEALGDDADLCIECSGAKGTVDAAIHACRPGSKVVMVGFGDMAMNVHLGMAAVREIDLIGAFANINDYPECIRLVSSGRIDVKSAITHRLPLDKVKDGMELIKTGQSVKVVIDCTR
ncbi:unnamed protein product [Lymnaea stagnalis]|uniref:Sorbitol dehydrogenase n=1 Tax=Lymnaea stagnalis TaxID=6523 RepID=A0AAV2I034_LYMST